MPRHIGASKFNNGSLTKKARTRKSRANRGHAEESRKALLRQRG